MNRSPIAFRFSDLGGILSVLIPVYNAENTLGRFIRDGRKEVNIFGKRQVVRAAVEAIDSFSGHADHSELMDYFHAMNGSRSKVWLVHGEGDRSLALCDALRKEHDGDVSVAELGSTVEF